MHLQYFSLIFCINFNSQLKSDILAKKITIPEIKTYLTEQIKIMKEGINSFLQEKQNEFYELPYDITPIDNFIEKLNVINRVFLNFKSKYLQLQYEFFKEIHNCKFNLKKGSDLKLDIISNVTCRNPYMLKLCLNLYLKEILTIVFKERINESTGNVKYIYETILGNPSTHIGLLRRTLFLEYENDMLLILFK